MFVRAVQAEAGRKKALPSGENSPSSLFADEVDVFEEGFPLPLDGDPSPASPTCRVVGDAGKRRDGEVPYYLAVPKACSRLIGMAW